MTFARALGCFDHYRAYFKNLWVDMKSILKALGTIVAIGGIFSSAIMYTSNASFNASAAMSGVGELKVQVSDLQKVDAAILKEQNEKYAEIINRLSRMEGKLDRR